MDITPVINQCNGDVHPSVMAAVIGVESAHNPFAIGVVGGSIRQPRNIDEAQQAVNALLLAKRNFSMGISQINRYNLEKYGLDYVSVFDPCKNVEAGSKILSSCFKGAKVKTSDNDKALKMSFSCYYSGNYHTGFYPDFAGQPSYVDKVMAKLQGVKALPVQNMKAVDLANFATNTDLPSTQVSNISKDKDLPVMAKVISVKASKKTDEKAENGVVVDVNNTRPSWDVFGNF